MTSPKSKKRKKYKKILCVMLDKRDFGKLITWSKMWYLGRPALKRLVYVQNNKLERCVATQLVFTTRD